MIDSCLISEDVTSIFKYYPLCRLLFPNDPELVSELFRLSEVDDTLRAQQLSLEQFEQLCNAFIKLLANSSSNDCNPENNIPEHTDEMHNLTYS